MEEEEPTRKTSLRRFLRGSDKKGSPSKAKGNTEAYSVASSSSYPTTGAHSQTLKNAITATATPNTTPTHKRNHPFGLFIRRRDLHLHQFFNRQNPQNQNLPQFSPPAEQTQSSLPTESSPTPAEAELSRALNQLSSVTRSGRLASSSSSGGFHANLLGKYGFTV